MLSAECCSARRRREQCGKRVLGNSWNSARRRVRGGANGEEGAGSSGQLCEPRGPLMSLFALLEGSAPALVVSPRGLGWDRQFAAVPCRAFVWRFVG